jgi:hypothetical protein
MFGWPHQKCREPDIQSKSKTTHATPQSQTRRTSAHNTAAPSQNDPETTDVQVNLI